MSEVRRDDEVETDSIEEETYLRPHRRRARFLLRTGLLALILLIYPVMSKIDGSEIQLLPSFIEQNTIWVQSFFASMTILLSFYMIFIVLSISWEYLIYSTPSQSSFSSIGLSADCGLILLGAFQVIALFQILLATSGLEPGIWFASAIICAALIVSVIMIIDY